MPDEPRGPDAVVARDGHVMTVTMNRPHRKNAMTQAMMVRLHDAWIEASDDPEIRCAIITGAGGDFSSGADLKAMAGAGYDPDPEIDVDARLAADPDLTMKALLRNDRCTKPVIAAVEGVCVAGGTELLQGTDIRVAGQSARFGVSEVRWSIYPQGGSSVRLRRQIPYTVAADLLLTGRHITADEALRIGLVGHVVPDGQALVKANELATLIVANGPLAVEAVLQALHETDGMTEREALDWEWAMSERVNASEDAMEGPRAFAEKRPAVYRRR